MSHWKFRSLYLIVIPEGINFRNRFLLKTITLAFALSIFATAFNISIGLETNLIAFTALSVLFFAFVYFLIRFKSKYSQARKFFVAYMIVALNFLWILNGGSKGPTLLIFQAIFALGLFIIPSRVFLTACIVFAFNLSALFFIEYAYPQYIIGYDSVLDRILDLYLITIIFLVSEIPLIYYANKNYKTEQLKAKRSEQIKSSFLANMSHEIRTPMNVLLGFSELLRDKDIEENDKNQYLDIIQKNGNLLLSVLDNVLDLSKLDANSMTVNKKPLYLKHFFENLKVSFQQKALKKGLDIHLNTKDLSDNTAIISDENILLQVFSNVINNAVKFTEQGYIQIGYSINENGSKITFFVKDSGIGIAPETLPYVFERFRQGDERLKRNYSGSGLGLTICKGLIELLGGKIWIRTTVNEGTSVYFSHDLELHNRPYEEKVFTASLN